MVLVLFVSPAEASWFNGICSIMCCVVEGLFGKDALDFVQLRYPTDTLEAMS